MQLAYRYLVKNHTILVSNEAGFVTEYRPVYHKHLKIYRGINNTLEFRLLNADQKPVQLSSTPVLVAYDENKQQVLKKNCTVLDDSSLATRGKFKLDISDNDTLNIDSQFLSYSVYLQDDNGSNAITYNNVAFDTCGTIVIESCMFPGPANSYSVTTFTEDNEAWYSEAIEAQPGINGNDALHTVALYTNNYTGTVTVQGTLENQIVGSTSWADVTSTELDGNETEPTPINFNGVYSYIRIKSSTNTTDKITKVLVRN